MHYNFVCTYIYMAGMPFYDSIRTCSLVINSDLIGLVFGLLFERNKLIRCNIHSSLVGIF